MNLKGWDIISITPLTVLNETLKRNWSKFNFDRKTSDYEINGNFGVWSFIPGGSLEHIRISCPITDGVLKFEEKELKLDGLTAVFNVMMNFFSNIEMTGKNAAEDHLNLQFELKIPKYITDGSSQKVKLDSDIGGVVEPIELIGGMSIYKYAILNGLADCLVANSDNVKMTFANVVLHNNGNWLNVKKCRYSYMDSSNPYMAILAVCTDKGISELPLDVDIESLDLNGKDSYYAVSKEIFTKNICVPCFQAMFPNSGDSYKMENDVLVNTTDLSVKTITVGAIDYKPCVSSGNAKAQIRDSNLHIDIVKGTCDLYASITMTWQSYNTFSCEYKDSKLQFVKNYSNFLHDEDIPWYLRFIPLSFIIDICVYYISDSLASGIDLKIDISQVVLKDVQWLGLNAEIKKAVINNGLIIYF